MLNIYLESSFQQIYVNNKYCFNKPTEIIPYIINKDNILYLYGLIPTSLNSDNKEELLYMFHFKNLINAFSFSIGKFQDLKFFNKYSQYFSSNYDLTFHTQNELNNAIDFYYYKKTNIFTPIKFKSCHLVFSANSIYFLNKKFNIYFEKNNIQKIKPQIKPIINDLCTEPN